MKIEFFKYQGTGNDFVILDNRENKYLGLTVKQVKHICNRRFGIGADGLMLLTKKEGYDFEMIYFNADGNESSMCGNGGRCLVKFAYHMGIHKSTYHFIAPDGEHDADIGIDHMIRLKMKNVSSVAQHSSYAILNTGSPHFVKFATNVKDIDVVETGREIRNSKEFKEQGINVNFVESIDEDSIFVRTYERGVEDETMSCGTGVTAAALVCYHNDTGYNDVTVFTKGGKLTVEYDRLDDDNYANIFLCGPAEKVYEGNMEV